MSAIHPVLKKLVAHPIFWLLYVVALWCFPPYVMAATAVLPALWLLLMLVAAIVSVVADAISRTCIRCGDIGGRVCNAMMMMRVRREAAGTLRRQADAQRRRDGARAECLLLYTLHARQIGRRFSRRLLDEYFTRFLHDNQAPEIVESQARRLCGILQEHCRQAALDQEAEQRHAAHRRSYQRRADQIREHHAARTAALRSLAIPEDMREQLLEVEDTKLREALLRLADDDAVAYEPPLS